jgi:hypothetical protein
MTTHTAPAWAVHLPTTDTTCVRLALPRRTGHEPWPFTLAVTELTRLGATPVERFRSLGAGRGDPLIASQDLTWQGHPLRLEAVTLRDGAAEVALDLPPWDELTAGEATEAMLWDLVDALAAAVDARHGAIGDGEPLSPLDPLDAALRRHLVVLAPAVLASSAGWLAADYLELPRSGLHVLLR